MSAAQFAADHFMELVVGGAIVLVGLCVFFCVSVTVIACAWRWRRKAIKSDATPIITEYDKEDSNINETQLVYQSQNGTQAKPEPDSQQKNDETTTNIDPSEEQGKEQCNEPPTTNETEPIVGEYSVIKLDQMSSTPTNEQAEYSIIGLNQVKSAPTATAAEYANINTSKQTTAPVLSSEDKSPEYANLQ